MDESIKEDMDEMLRSIDNECIKRGIQPLSVHVIRDDGAPSTAFLDTAKKFKLRLPDESDDAMAARIRKLSYLDDSTLSDEII